MPFAFRSLAAALVLSCGLAAPALAEPSILFDAQTGHVLESEKPFDRWYPASLTKLMTTYVVFDMVRSGEITLQSPIRMTKYSAKQPPSKMGYPPGSELTVDAALKILMVKSANDVAAAVGDSLGGSEAGWAARMNAAAKKLGMTGSRWVNANGLHDDNQYTTPRDLALLSMALRKEFPQYAGYFALEGIQAGKARIPSHNTLIGRFEGADGMKTGYTCPAGYNLVGSATRNGRTLIAVVMGSTSVAGRAEKTAAMLARGFAEDTMGKPTIATLAGELAGSPVATNMYDTLCSKAARQRMAKEREDAAKAAKEAAASEPEDQNADDAAAQKSVYLTELTRPPRLVTVSLGGATGPVPKAMAEAIAREDSADVPLPSWRPDRPPPTGAEPLAMQGDAAVGAE